MLFDEWTFPATNMFFVVPFPCFLGHVLEFWCRTFPTFLGECSLSITLGKNLHSSCFICHFCYFKHRSFFLARTSEFFLCNICYVCYFKHQFLLPKNHRPLIPLISAEVTTCAGAALRLPGGAHEWLDNSEDGRGGRKEGLQESTAWDLEILDELRWVCVFLLKTFPTKIRRLVKIRFAASEKQQESHSFGVPHLGVNARFERKQYLKLASVPSRLYTRGFQDHLSCFVNAGWSARARGYCGYYITIRRYTVRLYVWFQMTCSVRTARCPMPLLPPNPCGAWEWNQYRLMYLLMSTPDSSSCWLIGTIAQSCDLQLIVMDSTTPIMWSWMGHGPTVPPDTNLHFFT